MSPDGVTRWVKKALIGAAAMRPRNAGGGAEQRVESEIIEAVPQLAGRPAGYWALTPLGGITNRTYRVSGGGQVYALRIAADSTGYLDRRAEAHNARLAGALGIAPRVLHADDRVMLTEYLAHARPLEAADLAHPEQLDRIGATLRRLQACPEPFRGARHPFGEIDKYLRLHADPRSAELRRQGRALERAIAASPPAPAPAHVDPNPANFLACADGVLRLVDWEFSAMTDPCWDVGAVLSQTEYDSARLRRLAAATFADAGETLLARIGLFRAAMFLVAGSWCAMEAAFRADDALARMAGTYLDGFAAALEHPEMSLWLQGRFTAA